jgi:P27 family predicted phage terminase small subunit
VRRGPKPQPTAQRKLRGNPGRRPYNLDEPVLAVVGATFDDPPSAIAEDPVAAAEWRRLAPLLRDARMITDADRNVLIAACQQWSVYQDALVNAPAHRRVVRSPHDYPIPNPYVSIAHKALIHCERLWESLGLTPSARTRIASAPPTGPDDPFSEFDEPRIPRVTKGPTLHGRRTVDDEPTTH